MTSTDAKHAQVQEHKDVDATLKEFSTNLAARQEDLPPEFQKVLDDNFWDLIATGKDNQ